MDEPENYNGQNRVKKLLSRKLPLNTLSRKKFRESMVGCALLKD
jgi:hypothetical protein